MIKIHRSIFRGWKANKTDYPRVYKHVLAYKLPDKVKVAYLRRALLEKHKKLMRG